MAKEAKKKLYVNLQSGPVTVFDENRKGKSVQPWANRNRKTFGGTYIVAGEHYAQFVSKMGPLSEMPPGEKFNPALLPEDTSAADIPEAPKEPEKKPAPKKPEPPKEPEKQDEPPATGQTEGFPDGTPDGGSTGEGEVESEGGEASGEDAGKSAETPAKPKVGKVKPKGGKGKK